MTTRIDKASKEQQERSAFECQTCDRKYEHAHDESGRVRELTEQERSARHTPSLDEIMREDPSPFGP